jgi:hypothetical protein
MVSTKDIVEQQETNELKIKARQEKLIIDETIKVKESQSLIKKTLY